jgi:hypothetical protein
MISAIFFMNDYVEDNAGLQILKVRWSAAGNIIKHFIIQLINSHLPFLSLSLFPRSFPYLLVFWLGLIFSKIFFNKHSLHLPAVHCSSALLAITISHP